MNLEATIEGLLAERAALDVQRDAIDEAVNALRKITGQVKRPGPQSAAARQARALAKEPARKAPAPTVTREDRLEQLRKRQAERQYGATDSKGERLHWRRLENFEAWRRELLKPVLAHAAGTKERAAAVNTLFAAPITLPDGSKRRIGKTVLYKWIGELDSGGSATEDQSEGAAVDATPAAAQHVEASHGSEVENAPLSTEEASAPAADVGPRVRPASYSVRDMKRERQRDIKAGKRLLTVVSDRPLTRSECVDGPRPCLFVSCKHHLYLDVDPHTGSLKLNFPHLEPEQLSESCALDVAARGGIALEEVGDLANITRERVRQIEVAALERLRRRASHYELDASYVGAGQGDAFEGFPETIDHGEAGGINRAFAPITHAKLAEGERK